MVQLHDAQYFALQLICFIQDPNE